MEEPNQKSPAAIRQKRYRDNIRQKIMDAERLLTQNAARESAKINKAVKRKTNRNATGVAYETERNYQID